MILRFASFVMRHPGLHPWIDPWMGEYNPIRPSNEQIQIDSRKIHNLNNHHGHQFVEWNPDGHSGRAEASPPIGQDRKGSEMATKGAKRTEKASLERKAVADLLSSLGEITTRPQFGGYGVFAEGKMFALISGAGVLHLKVDDSNRGDYGEDDRFGRMPYYHVPTRVRDNARLLRTWARASIAAALG